MAALRGEGGPAGVAPGARQQARPLRVQVVRTGDSVFFHHSNDVKIEEITRAVFSLTT